MNMDSRYVECHQIEVTSLNRPDPRWSFTDAAGHVHRWHAVGSTTPATTYDHTRAHHVPTLVQVTDELLISWDEFDGDSVSPQWHYECSQCHEVIEPGRCADDTPRYINGLVRWKDFKIVLDHPKEIDELVPYMTAFLDGTEILVTHPLGFRIKAFVRSINTHGSIGETPDHIDIVVIPTGAPIP